MSAGDAAGTSPGDSWTGGEVGSAAWCVLAPNPGPLTLEGTNTWIIAPSSTEWAVVVDPGPADENHFRAIERRLATRGTRAAAVILTHGHRDHSAGATALASQLGCAVLALDATHASPGARLAPGDSIEVGSARLEVLATPGHSADSVSILVRSEGLLLTGDTVLGRGTSVVAYPDGTLEAYLASLRRLLDLTHELPVAKILPGHGAVVPDPERTLAGYLRHRAERLEQIETALAALGLEGAGLTDAVAQPAQLAGLAGRVVAIVYSDVPDSVRLAALASVLAQLEYLAMRTDPS